MTLGCGPGSDLLGIKLALEEEFGISRNNRQYIGYDAVKEWEPVFCSVNPNFQFHHVHIDENTIKNNVISMSYAYYSGYYTKIYHDVPSNDKLYQIGNSVKRLIEKALRIVMIIDTNDRCQRQVLQKHGFKTLESTDDANRSIYVHYKINQHPNQSDIQQYPMIQMPNGQYNQTLIHHIWDNANSHLHTSTGSNANQQTNQSHTKNNTCMPISWYNQTQMYKHDDGASLTDAQIKARQQPDQSHKKSTTKSIFKSGYDQTRIHEQEDASCSIHAIGDVKQQKHIIHSKKISATQIYHHDDATLPTCVRAQNKAKQHPSQRYNKTSTRTCMQKNRYDPMQIMIQHT